jgi:hypothetical protein
MMKRRHLFELSILAIAIVLVCPAYAWAYVDPGTGSYLFQVLIAGGLAGIYTLRRYWDAFKTAVQGKRGSTANRPPTTPPHGMA